jgi:putative addiction module component (TIGR02574 family)
MGETAEELLAKALKLGEKDRASLAGALIESLHIEPGSSGDAQWEQEILRRVRDLESRSVETIGWSEVRERLFRGYE